MISNETIIIMKWECFKSLPQSLNLGMPAIIFHSSRLSSVLPKKNPTAHSKGLSRETARTFGHHKD